MCAFIKFTANGCSKSDSLVGSIDARSTVTAQTGSADTHAASGAAAAQSDANTASGEVNCSRRAVCDAACGCRTRRRFACRREAATVQSGRRKQKSQRRFDAPGPRRLTVIGAFDFEVTKIDIKLPAFVD